MARVRTVPDDEATGDLAALFDEIRSGTLSDLGITLPHTPEVFRLLSIRPDLLRPLWETFRAIFLGGVLPRPLKEAIATTVSERSHCSY